MGIGPFIYTMNKIIEGLDETNKNKKLNTLLECFQRDPASLDLPSLQTLGQELHGAIGRNSDPDLIRIFNEVDQEIRERPFRWGNTKKGA